MIAHDDAPSFASALMKSGLDLLIKRTLTNRGDRGGWRASPTVLDHRLDLGDRTFEHRLDRAVGIVAHPSAQTETASSAHGPAPKPDTLDPPLDPDAHAFPLFGHVRLPANHGITVFNL